jgi:CubicO group peptidase (beta-lactamase class C family)
MVTLENWRSSPQNRWAFHHVRELIPTAGIEHDPAAVRTLPRTEGRTPDLEAFLAETDTDALVVLHRGRLVLERYFNGMKPGSPHILMSVSKSLLGLLAGELAAQGRLDADAPVTRYLPEAKGTGFDGATVRHLLDMRCGIDFLEDYLATSGPIVEYRKSTGWNPPDGKADLHGFMLTLKRARAHGGSFDYLSPNSDLLGWVMERAGGGRFADLMSELVWRRAGAEWPAYVTVDRLGSARAAGGVCTAARDLARVGQWMLERDDAWIRDIERGGDREAWAKGSFAAFFPGLPMSYRSQWYVLHGAQGRHPLVFALGIHGQYLFVDRAAGVVVAKFSSQALPLDEKRTLLTLEAVNRIRQSLAG